MAAMPIFDGELMELRPIPATHIDIAWAHGASALEESTRESGDEITASQLKMMLARGERTLLQMFDDKPAGWVVVKVEQLPNFRALLVTDLVAHNSDFQDYMPALKQMAYALGCSRVRCAAKQAQARLYRMKCDFKPVYEILEVMI